MSALTGTLELVLTAPPNDYEAVLKIDTQGLLERQKPWFIVNERQYNYAERLTHRRKLVKLGENVIGIDGSSQVDDNTHPLTITFIAKVRQTFNTLIADQL